ncbi:MAG: hydrogenase maturation protease [Thermoplasmatota archaeon]
MSRTKVMVIGVGSRIRGDDSAGPCTIDLLEQLLSAGGPPKGFDIELMDADVMPENFTKPMRESGADTVYFIDAVDMELQPGEIRRIPDELIEETIPCSHNLPVSYVMGYVREKVPIVELIGDQVQTTGLFEVMTEEVKEGCSKLAKIILDGKALEVPMFSKE